MFFEENFTCKLMIPEVIPESNIYDLTCPTCFKYILWPCCRTIFLTPSSMVWDDWAHTCSFTAVNQERYHCKITLVIIKVSLT